jgi:hypothetical protein
MYYLSLTNMKRSLIIFALLLFAITANAQSYSSPGIPAGTTSLTPTFRTKAATPDSLAQIWLAIGGNKFYRMLSGMDVIVFDARVVQGLGTTSSKLTFRDTLLKPNWIINPADTLHPALTVISDKAQAGLLIKPNESTDGRAVVQMRSAKNNQWWEVGANPAGQNKSFGIRRMNGVALPAVDYLWYVEPFTDTSVFPHQVRFTNTRAYTPGDSVAYLKNGFLEIGPAPSGGGTTTNPFTAATSGGASPGTTFDGSVARTFDYSSFGAAPAFTATGSGVILSSGNLGLGGSTTSSRTINFNTHFLEFTGTDFGGTTGTTIFQGNGFSSNITNAGGDHYGINISTAQAQLNGNNGSGNVASVNASSNHADLVFTDGSGINSISSTDNGIHIGSTIDFKAAYYDDVYLLPTGNYIPSKRQVDSIAKTKADSIFSGGGGGGNNIYNHTDSLTGNRKVNFVTHKLELGDVPNNRAYVGIDPTNSSINLYTYGLSGGTGNSTYTQNDESIFISNSDTSGYSGGFQIANNDAAKATTMVIINHGVQSSLSLHAYGENIFDDAIASKGIVYANNYGANFTDRSLVDKRYVDSVRAGGGAFLPLSFTSNTAIQQNGNKWDVYANNSSGGLHMQSDSLSGFDLYTSDSADAAHSEYTQNSDGANISTTNASNFANISTTGATGKVFMGSGDAAGDNPNISITPTDVIIEYQRFDGMSKAIILDSLSNNGIRINDDSNIGLAGTTLFPVSGDPNQFVQAGNLPSTTIHTSNGLSGDGSVGTPVVLGGTITGAGGVADIQLNNPSGANTAAFNVEDPNTGYGLFLGGNGTDFQSDMVGGAQDFSSNSIVNAASVLTLQLNVSATHKSITMSPSSGSGIGVADFDDKGLIGLDGGGSAYVYPVSGSGAQYAQYGHVQQPITLTTTGTSGASTLVGTTLNIPQYAGASPGNPSGLLTFTASNGSNATYLRNDGLHAIDSTVVRSVANSYSLSGMQTKLNNYALTSALPVGANPTATAGSSVVNGSATTFMRSDAAPKVDSAVFRTVANSYSLSGLQTKFNGYVPTSTTVAGFPLSSNVTLAALTATDATLTFSGSYTGATARTVGLNLGNANTWTAAPTVSLAGITTSITTDGILVTNPTLATSSVAIQNPPVIRMTGHAWNATATAADNQGDYIMGVNMDRSNPSFPDPQWFLSARLSAAGSGAYTRFLTYDFYNGLTVTQALSVTGGVSTGNGITNSSGTIRSANFSAASAGNTMFIGNGNNFSASGTGMDLGGSTITNSSGTFNAAVIHPTYNQTSTAAATDLVVNRIETGVGSGTQRYASFQTSGTENLGITNKGELILREGSNGFAGQTTLVSGTKAITITGVTTGSRAFISFVSIGGTVTTTWQYAGVCTANTLTITALTNAGTTDTSDTSTVNYEIIN